MKENVEPGRRWITGKIAPLKAKAEALLTMLEQRKILVIGGCDQLRWGNNFARTFNLNEAKHILLELDSNESDRV